MFERNKVDVEQGLVTVELTLSDGSMQVGKVIVPIGRALFEVLNAAGGFIEFENFEGERTFLAKHDVRALRLVKMPRAENLAGRIRDLDGFDPYAILGVARGTDWTEVRAAFHAKAKAYHPDRYANAELPDEVKGYLAAMARRINGAYEALEATRAEQQKRIAAPLRAQPIYESRAR